MACSAASMSGAGVCSLPPHHSAMQAWLRRRRTVSAALRMKSVWSRGQDCVDTGLSCNNTPSSECRD